MPRKSTSETPEKAVTTLGEPPKTWKPAGVALWHEVAAAAPWLCASDRLLVEAACLALANARVSWSLAAARQLSRALAALGLDVRSRLRLEQRKAGR